jgi:hypothetical protein
MKHTIEIERFSSFTLLKIILITSIFPWVFVDTLVILFHLIGGDFVVNYQSGKGADAFVQQISLVRYVLFSYSVIVLGGVVFSGLIWIPASFSMWCWSKFRKLEVN